MKGDLMRLGLPCCPRKKKNGFWSITARRMNCPIFSILRPQANRANKSSKVRTASPTRASTYSSTTISYKTASPTKT